MILVNHPLECLEDVYASVTGEEYEYDNVCLDKYGRKSVICYEMNITIDQTKQSWSNAEQKSEKRIIDILNESEPLGYMMFTEHQENGWIHFHGLVWYNYYQDSSRFLRKKLNRRIGNTLIQPLRDGLIDNVKRKYINWFHYMSKDQERWILSSEYYCDCGNVDTWVIRHEESKLIS